MDEERLVKSANYVRTELPVRIAHRLRDLQKLPYIVVTQEGIAKVYEVLFTVSIQFRKYPPITNIKENEDFCEFLAGLLDEHAIVIPSLSLGMSLSSPYLAPDDLDSFMRRMLVSRISRRVLAQHHIALSENYAGKQKSWEFAEPNVGIITTGLNVKASIEKCANLLRHQSLEAKDAGGNAEIPAEVVIEGDVDMRFSYIREHLECSIRATRLKQAGSVTLPPITATIAAGDNAVGIRISDQGGGLIAVQNPVQNPSDLFSFSHIRNSARMEHSRLISLRTASSYRRGIWATVNEQVENWNRSPDPEKDAGIGRHARMGIGLPMSNIFATYFGGSLDLKTLDGYGTDAYVRLPKLGTNLEAVNF
ncbi:branched-chain alpha-ketoacid dehydrogenase kinase [Lentinula aff. lateritia]|uniref:Branched-chain alpha-ketoacid dehydrogenase kinase n=1 Tax=Lentinula aff. lateritia TaxID=2804960 RepID=A0ACC1UEQ2_9AGAR|nr:branched-chain alpha-ketoacid dehydrogenase kinase [Lentinula aff. lateritia]